MPTTKSLLGLITVAAAGAIVSVLAARDHKRKAAPGIKISSEDSWKEGSMASFTGWLEKLKLSVDQEVRREDSFKK